MELKVNSKKLAAEISYAVSVLEHKSTIPILSHLFLQVSYELFALTLLAAHGNKNDHDQQICAESAQNIVAKSLRQNVYIPHKTNVHQLKHNQNNLAAKNPSVHFCSSR